MSMQCRRTRRRWRRETCWLLFAVCLICFPRELLAQMEGCTSLDVQQTDDNPPAAKKSTPHKCPLVRTRSSLLFPMSLVSREACHSKEQSPPECSLCRRSRCQLMRGCQTGGASGRNPMAETVFGRARVAPQMSKSEHVALLAARVSQSPAVALETTAIARRSGTAEVRYALALTAAYTIIKSDISAYRAEFNTLLRALRADARGVKYATSDLHFLEAFASMTDGEPLQALYALNRALQIESDFFAAAAMAARLQMMVMRQTSLRSQNECLSRFRQLFWYLSLMMDIQTCPRQAIHIEIYLRRAIGAPETDDTFRAARVYLDVMARRSAQARLSLEAFERAASPLICRSEIAADLGALVRGTADLLEAQ